MNYFRTLTFVSSKYLLATLLVVVGHFVGWAQRRPHAAFIPPTSYDERTRNPTLRYEPGGRPGSFRGLDGAWHPVQIADWLPDRVYLNESGNYYRAYSPEEMTAFVLSNSDTVITVAGVAPGKLGQLHTAFGQQLFRGAGMQLVDVTDPVTSLISVFIRPHKLLLRKNAGDWILLPKQKAVLQPLLLTLLADDPALVARLQAKRVGRWQVQRLLTEYADFRTTQFLQTAAQPRP
ncbi:hypothetical protein [Hymenobacter cellulosivorans]|uniref:DUF4230 domain-containing protein n=1 Tax=Hymenobacter cellulosivorans TaxID=2932249 RepID=A0ABY4FG13_9BACT|nr:hypothetical protein [Hymenobacter cellulosivorans]UOQ54957.1 hypothetical protein MUN80_09420 [Hymenobacter cellulosivorans]